MKRRFQNLHENTQTALLFLWISAGCAGGFGASLQFPFLAFATFVFASFCIVAFLTSLQFFATARRYRDEEFREGGERLREENEETGEPSQLSETLLRERAKLYKFVCGVTKQGILSEKAWKERGIPEREFRDLMTKLEKVEVVYPASKGKMRSVRTSFENALIAIEEDTGESGFWLPVIDRFNLARPANLHTAPQTSTPQPHAQYGVTLKF